MSKKISPYIFVGIDIKDSYNILKMVSFVTGYSIEQLVGSRKNGKLADARTLAAYMMLDAGMSTVKAARELGNMHHATIIYHRRKFLSIRDNPFDILNQWAKEINEKYNIDLLN